MKEQIQKNKGFVLLYSLLVTSVVLVISLTLSNIIFKQQIISSISREMNNAYYAANAGRECMHLLQSAEEIARTLEGQTPSINVSGSMLSCKDLVASVVSESPEFDWGNFTGSTITTGNDELLFTYNAGAGAQANQSKTACAKISPQSYMSDSNGTVLHVVWSSGYNTACNEANNNRKVERILCHDYDNTPSNNPDEICAAER